MDENKKLSYGFHFAFNIGLIVIAAFMLLGSIIMFLAGIQLAYYLIVGFAMLAISVTFLVVGIINTTKLSKAQESKLLDKYIGLVTFVFNTVVFVLFLVMTLLFYVLQNSLMFEFLYPAYLVAGGVSLICFVLLLVSFAAKLSEKTTKILTIVASFISIVPAGVLMYIFYSPYNIFSLMLFVFLEIGFGIYLIIDVCTYKEQKIIELQIEENQEKE